VPDCPYTKDRSPDGQPDLIRARALVRKAGMLGARVRIATWARVDGRANFLSSFGAWDDEMIRAMRTIGLRVEVKRFALDDFEGYDAAPVDLFLTFGPGEGGNDGRESLESITDGCPRHLDPGEFCDAKTGELWEKTLALPDGADKVRAWTALDDHLISQAAWLPVFSQINVVFLSKRIGNYGYQPAVGGSLWDRLTVR
jgi:hypothetical protein